MSRSTRTRAALTLAHYKRLVLMGKVTLPLEEARCIVGPDCAYHLYFRHAGQGSSEDEGARPRKKARTSTRGRRR